MPVFAQVTTPQAAKDVAALTATELLAGAVIVLALVILGLFRLFWGREKELVSLSLQASQLLGQQVQALQKIPEEIQDQKEEALRCSVELRTALHDCKKELMEIRRVVEGCLRISGTLPRGSG